jgi:hypothetical protein
MKKMKQTLNAKRSTPNAEFRRDSEFDIERWTLSVGRFRGRRRPLQPPIGSAELGCVCACRLGRCPTECAQR